jgi:DNA-binding SARP family transcriptional activator
LAVPDDGAVDVLEVERSIEGGRRATGRDDAAAARCFSRALAVYAGDLLPEEGPVEWVVKARERLRLEVAEAAPPLAEIELARGQAAEAAAAGERGLQIDRFRDGLWRLVVSAHEQSGDTAAAARSRRAYDEVLEELGLRT